ncbi:MAG TPA: M28 family peptidase [Candidatus Poseidoniales archaeon]|nr:MAG TPA: M28 family peptidase [Candidatus Poseidoniales archaeon]HII21284.1 M28 family peptidase [Candidatus Poseidoniaceae archaeon]
MTWAPVGLVKNSPEQRTAEFFNERHYALSMDEASLSAKTVAELKAMLSEQGLAVSGRKAELIDRILTNEKHDPMDAVIMNPEQTTMALEDDPIEYDAPLTFKARMQQQVYGPINMGAAIAIGLAVMMVSAVLIVQPAWLGFGEDYEYELIEFDAAQTQKFAQNLVDLGHPDWEGRMSGTQEEANAAQYIISEFAAMGMQTQLNSYEVPMHTVNSEPSLRICVQGNIGGLIQSPCEGPGSGGSDITEFQHRVDYVIQGFSGQSEYTFQQDVQLTDLGNGSDDGLWSSASGTIGYLRSGGSKISNTVMFSKAAENNLAGLIRVNKDYNCGLIEGNDCVPIFKGSSIDDVTAANGGTIPTDIPFIAMSKDAGEILEAAVFNATGTQGVLEMIIDVTNDQEQTIYVPCGIINGQSEEVVIIGAHHDTVYQGQGAVDDSSGTASVMEIGRQLSEVVNQSGTPERTIHFCTWGGEEEGLYGSRAYVAANQNFLRDNLRLYINLDMNHVDADANRGNSVSLFTNNRDDYGHIERITELYESANPDMAERYDIRISLLAGDRGDADGMPYNSDHGPFVYDLGDKTGRAAACYGSGSWEYHTYLDTMDRFNSESLGISVIIYGTYVRLLAYNADV